MILHLIILQWVTYLMSNRKLIGIYPGSFDPITLGHLDIIKRAARLVDTLIIAIGNNSEKQGKAFFNNEEKADLIKNCIKEEVNLNGSINIEVKIFNGLLVNFAANEKASLIIRGLRALSDFDFEFNLASGNQALNSDIESVFLMTSVNKQFISSKLVKEIFSLGGDISKFVPPCVKSKMEEK